MTGANIKRLGSVTNTPAALTTVPSGLFGFLIINPNAYDVFVKFYDAQAAAVTVGTTTPIFTVQVPKNLFVEQADVIPVQLQFQTAITVAITKGSADTDTVATDGCLVQILET